MSLILRTTRRNKEKKISFKYLGEHTSCLRFSYIKVFKSFQILTNFTWEKKSSRGPVHSTVCFLSEELRKHCLFSNRVSISPGWPGTCSTLPGLWELAYWHVPLCLAKRRQVLCPCGVCVVVHMRLMMFYVCRFQNSMLYKINMHYLPSKNLN